jgi:DNA invertase Pin-like site-specific DNA recombinase
MSRLIGYARVSTQEQELHLQVDALLKTGCAEPYIYIDKVSGAKSERPGLNECLAALKQGDTLVIWRLDRLGRSMHHLVSLIESLRRRGVGFKSLCEGAIDTTTASGELIFNIFSSLAQFERRLIQERTRAGLAAAKSRGSKGGRKRIASDNPKVIMAKRLHKDANIQIQAICQTLQISRATFYKYLGM